MEPLRTHRGIAFVLRRSNVDTDQIVPSPFLKRITRHGFEDALFYHWRQDSDFGLDRPPGNRASVLLAAEDFATGSSREQAVWALHDFGFRVVLSPRFGDIFAANAGKSGLLAGVVSADDLEAMWEVVEKEPETTLTVSLEDQTVTCGDLRVSFSIDEHTKFLLLNGLDPVALTLSDEPSIADYETSRDKWLPVTLPPRSKG
jgi:3-isopropylmalate/(R)-2-methylmalate dehydratase small subunit